MSTGQAVGAVVGGVIGAAVGGPAGAVYGAQIGMAVGGALDPPKGPTIEGPRLNDLTVQTSTYGQFIPRTYGTIGLSGNVFWLENNKIKEVVKKKKSGGKGGGSAATTKTYTYFATFAIGLCEGPIAGIRRVWVGPDLLYDSGSDDIGTIIASNSAASGFTVYLGTDTQQPDPRIQAEMGAANCPAYRGLAYIVMKDLKLAKYGNSVAGAQVRVEVVNSKEVAGITMRYPAATMTTNNGNLQNAPFVSADGVFIWDISDTSTTPIITRSLMGSDGVIRRLDSRQVTMPYGFVFGDKPNGQGDANYLGYPLSLGNKGITLLGTNYSIKTFYHPTNATDAASAYCINNGYVYFASFAAGNTVRFSRGNISTGEVVAIPVAGTAPSGYIDYVGVVGSTIAIGFSDATNGGVSWVRFFDLSTLGLVASVSLSSLFSQSDGLAYFITEFSGGKMYSGYQSTGVRYAIDEYNATPILIGNFSTEFQPASSSAVYRFHEHGGIYFQWHSDFSQAGKAAIYTKNVITPQAVSLNSIVATEAARSSLVKPSDIDTTGLTDSVTGFKVTATGSIRNAIEPLRGAWPFDVVQSGYKIKATSRGSSSVVTIPVGELAIDTQLTESREMDSQLPQNVTVKYIDQGRDYDVNEQRAQRDNTEAVNSLNIDLPVVLSATQAAQVADKLIRIYALEKSDFSFTLPAPYRYLEPGDVITISTDDADFVLRLVSVNHTADGRLECAGRPSSASTYVSIAPGDQGQGGQVTIPLAGSTIGMLIDAPVIDEELQDSPGFACSFNGYSSSWPGGTLFQTADNGQTWTDLQGIGGQSTSGTASTLLAASAGNLVQRGGSLTVSMLAGTLESVTEAQMFNGANIAVYGQPGRWEVVRFQNATLVSAGVYTLDTFWRGDRGTEWATGLHIAGDQFILMTDPDLAFVGMPVDIIGSPRQYRAITNGAAIDSAASQSFTYLGVNLEAYSGAHPVGSRSSNDLTISWKRRTRVGGAWRDNVDASLGETSEAYEVDIMQGATVKRTLAATTPSVLYTSAMQVADFGSNQASVVVNIYQLSSVVGRGYPLGATL
jgi:hypothetical protein